MPGKSKEKFDDKKETPDYNDLILMRDGLAEILRQTGTPPNDHNEKYILDVINGIKAMNKLKAYF